jgi:hypothetical protein
MRRFVALIGRASRQLKGDQVRPALERILAQEEFVELRRGDIRTGLHGASPTAMVHLLDEAMRERGRRRIGVSVAARAPEHHRCVAIVGR